MILRSQRINQFHIYFLLSQKTIQNNTLEQEYQKKLILSFKDTSGLLTDELLRKWNSLIFSKINEEKYSSVHSLN